MKVSVFITTYNQEKYIAEAIESVLAQRCHFDFEIIIGEDCSQDKTPAICQKYAEEYPDKIRLFCHPVNLGLVENYHFCLSACRGEYIAYLGGDDFWIDRFKLQKQAHFFDANSDYGLLHTGYGELTNETGRVRFRKRKAVSGWLYDRLMRRGNFVAASSVFIRADFLKQVNVPEILGRGFLVEDYPLWLALSRVCKIGVLLDTTTMYRLHGKNVSRGSLKKRLDMVKTMFDILQFYYDRYGASCGYDRLKYRKNLDYMTAFVEYKDYEKARQYFSQLSFSEKMRHRIITLFLKARFGI